VLHAVRAAEPSAPAQVSLRWPAAINVLAVLISAERAGV
jgi:hypothetical protein